MQWILLGVLALALLAMSARYPKAAFSILGALGVAAAVIIFTSADNATLTRQKLPVEDIHIENMVITRAYGGSYQLQARLVNNHPDILLKESVLSITMLDCSSDADDSCTVLGQTDKRINTKIPPGQARDISINLVFSGAKPSGTLRWQYRINQTRS